MPNVVLIAFMDGLESSSQQAYYSYFRVEKAGLEDRLNTLFRFTQSLAELGYNPDLWDSGILVFLTKALHCLGGWCVMLGSKWLLKYIFTEMS